jgi:hypothetical protein
MSVDFDVVDVLAGLAEDLRSEGDFVARIHDAVAAMKKELDEARAEVERLRYALKGMVNTCRLDCTAASHCGVCAIAFRALPLPEDKR